MFYVLIFCTRILVCSYLIALHTLYCILEPTTQNNEYMSTTVSTICIYSSVISLCTYYARFVLSWSQINLVLIISYLTLHVQIFAGKVLDRLLVFI